MSIDPAKLELLLLNQAHEWLEHFDKIDLHLSSQLLIPQMQQALGRGDHAAVRSIIERLIDLSTKIQDNSSAEDLEPSIIRIECALAAYQMKNYNEAIKLLDRAIQVDRGLKARHLEGTIKFMLGCIQWQLSDQGDNAIISWEDTIKIYRELEKRNSDTHVITRSDWYSVRLAEIKTVLEGALDPTQPVRPPTPPSSSSSSSAPNPAPGDSPSGGASISPDTDILKFLPISDEIPAGGFGPAGIDLNPIGYVEIRQFIIDGCPYSITNLRGNGRIITFIPGQSYGIIKAAGDSMDRANIDNGDYVLLRIQSAAEPNDIVAAKIIRTESQATLKKFLRRPGKIILQFCSNNSSYKEADGRDKEFEFSQNPDDLQIVGIAIAVFKPI